MAATVETFLTPGEYEWTCPNGVTSALFECYGAGGTGAGSLTNNALRAGAAGAQYANKQIATVPGNVYTIVVGAAIAGTIGNVANGNDSYVELLSVLCRAKGGQSAVTNTPGTGSLTDGIGDIVRKGGNGTAGLAVTSSGGGGGAAGASSDGSNPILDLFYNGGIGGGGLAGNGGDGRVIATTNYPGLPGIQAGGGGSGAFRYNTNQNGGTGGNGAVVVTYTPALNISNHHFILAAQ